MRKWTTKKGYILTQVMDGACNVFLLSNGVTTILIDTNRKKNRTRLINQLKLLGVEKIDLLVLTHTHYDHAENAAFIQRTFKAKVIVHTSEAGYLQMGDSPLPKGTILPTRLLIDWFGKVLQPRFSYEPCNPDILIDHNYSFSEYGFNVFLLHIPGHSPGMMSLIIDDEIALVGDTMIGAYSNSIFTPFGDDVAQIIESWGTLLETNCRLFIPAHGTANSRELVEKCYRKRKLHNG